MHGTPVRTIGLDVSALDRRLAELRDLHDRGAITEVEHHAARAAAFDEV
jgi:hypothetical protein